MTRMIRLGPSLLPQLRIRPLPLPSIRPLPLPSIRPPPPPIARSPNRKITTIIENKRNSGVAPTTKHAGEAVETLFKGSETVEDSVLDGYYCIRNMDRFEGWIRERKSTLCKPPLEQDVPKKKKKKKKLSFSTSTTP